MILPTPAKIEDLLNASSQLEVPRYQRDYKWSTIEATEFIEDLDNYVDGNGAGLFLGTIVFDVSEESKQGRIRVVDGQQRITTILLLLMACKSVAKKINNFSLAQEIQKKITFTDSATGKSKGCRLISSESIRDVFELIAQDNWDGEFPLRVNGKSVMEFLTSN